MEMKHLMDVVRVKLVIDKKLLCPEEMNKPGIVASVVGPMIADSDREVLAVVSLKTNGQALNVSLASVGTIDRTIVVPREIYKSAILSNASSIILMHNHPSGSLQPSEEDKRMTERMEDTGALLGICVLDHIIVGGGTDQYFSFRENNMMKYLLSGELRSIAAEQSFVR